MSKKILLISAVCFILSCLFFNVRTTRADISECTVSVDPTSMQPSNTYTLSFPVINAVGANDPIVWVKITRPSSNYTIGSSSSWTSAIASDSVTYTGGEIAPTYGGTFTFTVTTGASEVGSENWTVQVSADSGGASPVTCTGSLGTSISSGASAPAVAVPVMSSLVVSDVLDSSVKITWTTDLSSDSTVDYGTSDAYGSSTTGNSSTTSHSVSLTGLSANTTYHYNAKSANSGGTVESSDNTFVTAKTGVTGTTTTGTTTTTTVTVTVTPTPKPTPRPDRVAPVVSLENDFEKSFKETPKITGKATDSDGGGTSGGVSSLEYSIDDGKNWLLVDNVKDIGAKSTIFDFTPAIFEDGDYKLKVRAKDPSGNTGSTTTKNMVIDRLPPQSGGVLFSIGPQILSPNKDGLIITLAGLEQKITLSAVGGPTEIAISHQSSVVSLVKNLDSGLWSGVLNFSEPGIYQLNIHSKDGAKNKTEKNLNTIVVLDSGVIKDGGGKVVKDAKVSLYYFEPSVSQFVLWDGQSFAQKNPQKSDDQGRYNLLIPPGKYYLQISAKGYKTLKTNIFTTNKTMPLNTDFTLKPFSGLHIGPFWFAWPEKPERVEVKTVLPDMPGVAVASFVNKEMPFFSFKNNGSEFTQNNLKGKPSVVTFLSIWSPQTFEQLPILNSLTSSKEINSLAIMVQDTVSKVSIFRKIGGYKVPIVADPDGVLIEPLGILNLPTHVFLDRKGIIRKIKVGVFTKEELLEDLVN